MLVYFTKNLKLQISHKNAKLLDDSMCLYIIFQIRKKCKNDELILVDKLW